MNDINKMPPVCAYCPYWEVCKPPYICPDIGDKEPKRTEKRTETHASDCISRQAMLDLIEDDSSNGVYSCFASYEDAQKFKQKVMYLPSAQPERKKGKWIAVTEDGDVYKRICSCCGQEAFFQDDDPDELYDGGRYELSDFCPHCGAKMEVR